MDLERDLRNALERKPAPAGFTARVMDALEQDGARPQPDPRFLGMRWRAVAAAALLTVTLGGWAAHQVQQRREAERAKEEVLFALRITSEKLNQARTQLDAISNH